MNRVIIIVAFLLAVVMTAGCPGKNAEKEALEVEKVAIKAVLYNSVKSLQQESLEGYLDTVHPESPGYAKMKTVCPEIFKMYDLEHELVDVKVLDITGNEARVQTMQVARRLAGPENFRNNRSTSIHTLKKYQGQWKVYETEQKGAEFLD